MLLFRSIGIARLPLHLDDPVIDGLANRGMALVREHWSLRLRCGNKSGLMGQICNDVLPRTSLTLPTDRPLLLLLDVASLCDSSDPRDRFFGVFGLCTNLEDSGLEVDYAKEVKEIELKISKHLIRQGDGLRFLKNVWYSVSTANTSPSWLPGWTHHQVYNFSCGKRKRTDIPYRNNDSYIHPIHLKDASNILCVRGYFLDIIEELTVENNHRKSGPQKVIGSSRVCHKVPKFS